MDKILRVIRMARHRWQQMRLERGEAGLGRPVTKQALLSGISLDRQYRVAVIGAGNQGIAQCAAILEISGAELAGVADLKPEKRHTAQERFGLSDACVFSDAGQMLDRIGSFDLLSIATTAPYHADLVFLAGQRVKRVVIEKPLDTSLSKGRALKQFLHGSGCLAAVNYSRRWLLDYQAIRRYISQGIVGQIRSLSIMVGKGELAMHGSHYFDLSRFLLNAEPCWGMCRLEPLSAPNARGSQYEDPSGFAVFQFANGARAFIDFSSDLGPKDASILIKGTHGSIAIYEQRLYWNYVSGSGRIWTVRFAEAMRSQLMFRRVLVQTLTGPPLGTVDDGLAALEMIYACHLSNRSGGAPVSLPLHSSQPDLGILFP